MLTVFLLSAGASASAPAACHIDDICDPKSATCEVTGEFTITDSNCAFDAGERDIRFRGGSALRSAGRSFTVSGLTIQLDANSLIQSQWAHANGGVVLHALKTIDHAGRIDVKQGALRMEASHDVTIDGAVIVGDGYLGVFTDGNIDVDHRLSATSEYGGSIELAGHQVAMSRGADLRGTGAYSSGGTLTIEATDTVALHPSTIDSRGTYGGATEIFALGRVTSWATVLSSGKSHGLEAQGGYVYIWSPTGVGIAGGKLHAKGGINGEGGSVDLVSNGVVNVQGTIDVSASGADSWGGSVSAFGDEGVLVTHRISANGGYAGIVDLRSELATVDVDARITANGKSTGGYGEITVDAARIQVTGELVAKHFGTTRLAAEEVVVSGRLETLGMGGENLIMATDVTVTGAMKAKDLNTIMVLGQLDIDQASIQPPPLIALP
jgi:hypothetical protein